MGLVAWHDVIESLSELIEEDVIYAAERDWLIEAFYDYGDSWVKEVEQKRINADSPGNQKCFDHPKFVRALAGWIGDSVDVPLAMDRLGSLLGAIHGVAGGGPIGAAPG